MTLFELDVPRARAVAAQLTAAYKDEGIFGNQEMPEDLAPPGVDAGSEEHMRFITLTVAIDYMRNADQLWQAARRTYADAQTRYLFDPPTVADTGPRRVMQDMQRYGLSRKPEQDAGTWQTISTTLAVHFEGRVEVLVDVAAHDAIRLLELVRSRRHAGGFPFLKGPKIGPLWVRMLHDNCGLPLVHIADVPLPVDIHTAQATIQTGCVRTGAGRGTMAQLRGAVQQVWREALAGGPAYPLRLDEPLWLLSRAGCRVTQTWPCEFRGRCPVAGQCQAQHHWLGIAGSVNQDGSEWTIRLDSPARANQIRRP